jgi:hypothetical protein
MVSQHPYAVNLFRKEKIDWNAIAEDSNRDLLIDTINISDTSQPDCETSSTILVSNIIERREETQEIDIDCQPEIDSKEE